MDRVQLPHGYRDAMKTHISHESRSFVMCLYTVGGWEWANIWRPYTWNNICV